MGWSPAGNPELTGTVVWILQPCTSGTLDVPGLDLRAVYARGPPTPTGVEPVEGGISQFRVNNVI